jgi:hypothetical protein
MVEELLAQVNLSVDAASFDVAGPVIDGHVKTTNLPSVLDERTLTRDLHLRSVHLMNDLEAVARAVPVLRPGDLITLNIGCRLCALRGNRLCRLLPRAQPGVPLYDFAHQLVRRGAIPS